MNREEFLKFCAKKKQYFTLSISITVEQNNQLKEQARKHGVKKADYVRSQLFYEEKE